MTVYLVWREGVYRHEFGGIFSTLEEATDAAGKLIRGECDNYHEWLVAGFELGVASKQSPLEPTAQSTPIGPWRYFRGGEITEPPILVRLSRSPDGTITEATR